MTPSICGLWRFLLISNGLLRIEWAEDGRFNDAPTAVVNSRLEASAPLTCKKDAKGFVINNDTFSIKLARDCSPFNNPSGLVVHWQRGGMHGVWRPGAIASNLGGYIRALDFCGTGIRHQRLKDGLLSRAGWFLFDDSLTPLLDASGNLTPCPAGRRVDWYLFVYGKDYASGLSDLMHLFGRPPLPPRKMFGFWWSRWHAYTEDEFKSLVHRFKEEGLSLSVLVLDMDWHKDGWCNWDWDADFFPDPEKFISWCHREGLLLTLNVHPQELLRTDSHFETFCRRAGLRVAPEQDRIWINLADPRQKKAAEDLLIAPFHRMGVDVWWIDGDAAQLGAELSYQFWTNHVYFQAAVKSRGRRRPVIFSRCGGWGNQRYPIGFSGDTVSEWHVLRYQIPFTVSGGNIGFHYWSNDTGGFMGEHLPDDLYVRWFQFSALSPILRMHCSHGDREPWAYNTLALKTARRFYNLRQQLLPYLYSVAHECTDKNLPMCRPLYLSAPEDTCSYEHPEEYLLGRSLLCAPIFEQQVKGGGVRTVYFPEGLWWDFFTDDVFCGPAARRIASPLTRMPLYVRGGSLIPMLEDDAGALEIHAFAGSDGTAEFYDDDGETTDYERGGFARLDAQISFAGDSATFTANPWSGKFAKRASDRRHVLCVHTPVGLVRRELSELSRGKMVVKKVALGAGSEKALKRHLILSDLRRRLCVARALEELCGSDERILGQYSFLMSEEAADKKVLLSFFAKRLGELLKNSRPHATETHEMLLQELLGVHAEVRLADSGEPDFLLATARLWSAPTADKGWRADLRWSLPEDWRCGATSGIKRGDVIAGESIFSQVKIHTPASFNILGGAEFGAEVELEKGKRRLTFHPCATLDLAGIREAWVIGPFDGEGVGWERVREPEKGFDATAEYQGKHGPVRWRHVRIPIDGRDIWSNFPLFDMRKILDTRGGSEIAYLWFRVHAARKGRYNIIVKNDGRVSFWVNKKPQAQFESFIRSRQIDLEKGMNEILFKVQRTWGDWDFGVAIVSFANSGPPENLQAPSLK